MPVPRSNLEKPIRDAGAEIVRGQLPTVTGNSKLLGQLYQNLIENAVKFAADRSPVVELTAERAEGWWTLGVKDNGIGIKPEYFERIFRPFQRLHGRSEYQGTGIGLAICKKVLQKHGGAIWVESEPGAGAHFKFTLKELPEENS